MSSMVHITELKEEEDMMMDEDDQDELEDMDIDMDTTKDVSEEHRAPSYSVELDIEWVQQFRDVARSRPPQDPDRLSHRLSLAFSDPLAVPANENLKATLTNLLQFGLVVEQSTVEESSVPEAQFIAATILSTGASKNEFHFTLRLGSADTDSPRMKLPCKSMLLLRSLAEKSSTNIFMFSTRSKSIAFLPPDATHSIGFLHRIDSTLGVSDYLVLTASQHTGPAIARPPRSRNQDPLPFTAAAFRKEERSATSYRPRSTVPAGKCHEGVKRAL
ncbi:MAG: hypothetical protein J3Q66DRAFT_40682 [Benniella sp.]|nr:MAG: hypothetical protein J3Q66DRAFT_40682 [Benniella sp.]